ncbi:substrate-binding domain-containing protein [Deinococcus aquiradiocola]|uniref:substrate-binding domain-containing protein n=1 Tax=Deinococcus aquiradiocola TaxID=393059 RepID=UPI00166300D0|nr:substrate-binding domain-containing protein [Deinococcus aquiradiocola]
MRAAERHAVRASRGSGSRPGLALLLRAGPLIAAVVGWGLAVQAGPPEGQPAPDPPGVSVSLPLRVVGSTPLWVGGAVGEALPTEDAFAELYAGRADLVLGTLPPPVAPRGVAPAVSVPVGVYAVSVAYSLPGVQLRLDVPTLCALLSGRVSRWDAPAVAALNPGVRLPALPVLVSARTARNGVSLAVAGACVKAGVWPSSQLKSSWAAGAAFGRATLGAQRTDLNLPGALAVFALQATPRGVQVAQLRAPGGAFVSPVSELGVTVPGAPGVAVLPGEAFGVLRAADRVGAYPLRGLVWASFLPEQAYRDRTLERARALLRLLGTLRSGGGRGVAGLPVNAWGPVVMTFLGARVTDAE